MTLPSPATLGAYEIVRPLGADVFLARQADQHRLVVLKPAASLEAAHAAVALSHPCVVATFDAFLDHGRAYVAQEHLPGGSLRARGQALSLPQIAGVLESVLAALQHAHARDLAHGDVRSASVLIGHDGLAKLADFGLVPGDAAGDLYGVGALAYELVTPGLPFHPRLGGWIQRMMDRDPARRPTSAGDAWLELEDIVVELEQPFWRRRASLDAGDDVAVPPAPVSAPPAPAPRPRRRRRLAVVAAATALTLGAAGGAYVVFGSAPEPVVAVAPVEAKIRELVRGQTPVDGVRCPRDVPDRPGVRFACDVALGQTDQRLIAIVTHQPGGADAIALRLR